MRPLHLISGLVLIVIFVLTGQYMDKFYNHLDGMEDGLRMFFRSRHIYILLSGLAHLGIGSYITLHKKRWRMVLQILGSVFLLVSSGFFVAAFFIETKQLQWDWQIARTGIFLAAYGTIFHFIGSLGKK